MENFPSSFAFVITLNMFDLLAREIQLIGLDTQDGNPICSISVDHRASKIFRTSHHV